MRFSRRSLLAGMVALPLLGHAQTTLNVAVSADHMERLGNFIKDHPEGLESVTSLKSPHMTRLIAEVVILAQALRLGGQEVRLNFVQVPNYARSLLLLQEGAIDAIGQSVWRSDYKPDTMVMSDAVMANGKFVKGLYTDERRVASYKIDSVKDLENYTIVGNGRWTIDWETMKRFRFKEMIDTNSLSAMFNLVLVRSVDFVLAEWSPDADMKYRTPAGVLAPVPGVSVALNDARHFAISKKTPKAAALASAISKGIDILNKRKTLERFYTEAGFYRPEVASYKTLKVQDR